MWQLFTISIIMLGSLNLFAQTDTRQDRIDDLNSLRLGQLRSGGVALLPIRLTLTMPPTIETPDFRMQRHMEESMTGAFSMLHKDIKVTPPGTTSRIFKAAGIRMEGQMRRVVQGDSMALRPAISSLIRSQTDSRFIMAMSLANEDLPPELRPKDTGDEVDSIMVVCRIWDGDTGQLLWRFQHIWDIPTEPESIQMFSSMKQLCAKIMAQIPQ